MTDRSRPRAVITRAPLRPERLRHIDGGFAFIPHRFLREGFFASLTRDEAALYLLLVLVGDRNGVSFYHYDSLCSLLEMLPEDYVEARDRLLDKDLIAFDGTRFQVLSLPNQPVRIPTPGPAPSGSERRAIRSSIREALKGPEGRRDHER